MVAGRCGRRGACGAAVIAAAALLLAACGSTPPSGVSPSARIEWVEATDDLEAVGRAARLDPSRHVRRAAVERLRDQDVLWEVATSDPDGVVRRQAIAQLTDARRVARIATTAAWWKDRAAAVAVTEDRVLLGEVATLDPDPEVRREALARLQAAELRALVDTGGDRSRVEVAGVLDPDDPLLDLLARDRDPRVRAAAVERAADPTVAQRALADADPVVRRAALGRDAVSDRVPECARSDLDPGVRAAAVRRLDDPIALAEIVGFDPDDGVRAAAASRLTDQAVLVRIAATDRAPGVRAVAAVRLDDSATLLDLATHDPAPEVRSAVVRRITDQDALRSLAEAEDDPRVRHEIALRVADQDVLARLAGPDAPLATRLLAARRLLGPRLADLALHDPSWYVRWTAVARLDDAPTLDRLAGDPHVEVRQRALRRRGVPGCEGVLIACPRLEGFELDGDPRAVVDRRALRDALTGAVSDLPVDRIELTWTMEDTPYVSPELGTRATVWVERVEGRFVVAESAVSTTARGARAGRVAELADAAPAAGGRIVELRPAEVDAVAWLEEVLDLAPDLPGPGPPDGLMAPAVELARWQRATDPQR